jgi:hypothetical protein
MASLQSSIWITSAGFKPSASQREVSRQISKHSLYQMSHLAWVKSWAWLRKQIIEGKKINKNCGESKILVQTVKYYVKSKQTSLENKKPELNPIKQSYQFGKMCCKIHKIWPPTPPPIYFRNVRKLSCRCFGLAWQIIPENVFQNCSIWPQFS